MDWQFFEFMLYAVLYVHAGILYLRPQNKSSTFALKKTSDEGGCTPEKYTKNEKLNQLGCLRSDVRPVLVGPENTLKKNTSRYSFGRSSKNSLCMVPNNTSRNVEMSEVLFSFFKMSK